MFLIISKHYSRNGNLASQRSLDEKFSTWAEAEAFMATLPEFPYGESGGRSTYHISAPVRPARRTRRYY